MVCVDCRESPTQICAYHRITDNLHTESDMEIDEMQDRIRELEGQVEEWKSAESQAHAAAKQFQADLAAERKRAEEAEALSFVEIDGHRSNLTWKARCEESERLWRQQQDLAANYYETIASLRSQLDEVAKDRDELIRYIDEAKKACGDDRVTGEPLAQVIASIRAQLGEAREHADFIIRSRNEEIARLKAREWIQCTTVSHDCLGGCASMREHDRYRHASLTSRAEKAESALGEADAIGRLQTAARAKAELALAEAQEREARKTKALAGLADWKMRDGSPCFCPAGRNEDEPKGRMPTVHSTACEEARAALSLSPASGAETAKCETLDIEALVQRFLHWPLPDTVKPDGEYPAGKTREKHGDPFRLLGTNLLDADEARQMITYLLSPTSRPERSTSEGAGAEPGGEELDRWAREKIKRLGYSEAKPGTGGCEPAAPPASGVAAKEGEEKREAPSARFRLVHFLADPFNGIRFPIGAVVEHRGRIETVASPLLPCATCVTAPGASLARMLAGDLPRVDNFDRLPSSFGPQAALGLAEELPAEVTDPVEWVRKFALPAAEEKHPGHLAPDLALSPNTSQTNPNAAAEEKRDGKDGSDR